MPHYLAKTFSAESRTVGQDEPLAGRTDMARNNASGFSFKVTPQVSLERFLVRHPTQWYSLLDSVTYSLCSFLSIQVLGS